MLWAYETKPTLVPGSTIQEAILVVSLHPLLLDPILIKTKLTENLEIVTTDTEEEIFDPDTVYYVGMRFRSDVGYSIYSNIVEVIPKRSNLARDTSTILFHSSTTFNVPFPLHNHPRAFFTLSVDTIGSSYSFFIDKVSDERENEVTVYASLRQLSPTLFVDTVLEPSTAYRITLVTHFGNNRMSDVSYNVVTAPALDNGQPFILYIRKSLGSPIYIKGKPGYTFALSSRGAVRISDNLLQQPYLVTMLKDGVIYGYDYLYPYDDSGTTTTSSW